jgi:hypothetical protein
MTKCKPASNLAQHFCGSTKTGSSGQDSCQGTLYRSHGKGHSKEGSIGADSRLAGAGFVPNVKIEDILRVVRDYDRYKDVYRPGVIDSAFRRTDGMQDFFFMRLANRSVVAKTALDTEGVASYIRVDDKRWYGISNTTEIREIDKFGTEEQRTLPPDDGTGLIWRLSSITRLEERDGGVYAELEAIALSRDIPVAFRLFVTPIVRRLSRDSLATSLHQTKVAIDDVKLHHAQENQ